MKIKENESIKPYSSMKVGGVAKKIYFPESIEEIAQVLNEDKDVIVLGNCTNVLIPDGDLGKSFMILRENFSEISIKEDIITAQAGAKLRALSQFALSNDKTGFEFLDGIPGSVGGAIYMNAGAFGGEIKNIIKSVKVIKGNKIKLYTRDEIVFEKRFSTFQESGEIIFEAEFFTKPGNYDEILAVINDLNGRRRDKQPLNFPSCGSVFKRPESGYASQMIDEAGLKGLKVGGAMVSEKHAGFIINYDNATFEDVTQLIKKVQDIIYEKYGVKLELEIRVLR